MLHYLVETLSEHCQYSHVNLKYDNICNFIIQGEPSKTNQGRFYKSSKLFPDGHFAYKSFYTRFQKKTL